MYSLCSLIARTILLIRFVSGTMGMWSRMGLLQQRLLTFFFSRGKVVTIAHCWMVTCASNTDAFAGSAFTQRPYCAPAGRVHLGSVAVCFRAI